MANVNISGTQTPAKRSYTRTDAHRTALVEFNQRTKRKFPKEYDSKSRLYIIFKAMHLRCYYPSHEAYDRYGGAGITVCDEWHNNYSAFMRWALSNGYQENLTIDRIENGDIYRPGNCRWATMLEQQNNKSGNVTVTAFGETKSITAWVRDARCKVHYQCLWRRLKAGEAPEEALSRPIATQKTPTPRFITAFGETRRLMDWIGDHRCIVAYYTLSHRYKEGWDGEEALTVPIIPRVPVGSAHCLRGLEFTPENTKIEANGTRRCRECTRERDRRRRRKPHPPLNPMLEGQKS